MKREAYITGWRDAISAVTRAANTLLMPPDEPQKGKRGGKSQAAPPAPGSNIERVLIVVKANPGMTGAETVKAVHQAGHDIGSESIRTCLHRLAKRGLAENLDGKWFAVAEQQPELDQAQEKS